MPKHAVLEDLDEIRKIDRSNMLSFIIDMPKHYEEAASLSKTLGSTYAKPKAIVVAGMGGSAIGGELLKDWARNRVSIPIEVCREYSLPAYADNKTVVFVVSYSGETEESLSAFLDAIKRGCKCICISSGGALNEFAQKFDVPYLQVPSGNAPRAALPYLFVPLLFSMEKMGLVSGVDEEIRDTIKVLRQVCNENSPTKPLASNFSKALASNIFGSIPIIYGFGVYRSVAQRYKAQFNENSKMPSKWESFPELNHNEIVGWEAANELAKFFSIIFIRDDGEEIWMRQRIEATKELLQKQSMKLFEVWSRGSTVLAKMCSAMCVGDLTSVYLAILRGIDPTPVRTISLLKDKLGQSGKKEKVIRELRKLA